MNSAGNLMNINEITVFEGNKKKWGFFLLEIITLFYSLIGGGLVRTIMRTLEPHNSFIEKEKVIRLHH